MVLGSYIFIAIIILVLSLKLYLNKRQQISIIANINHVPEKFSTKITLSEHQKAGHYNLAKLKLNNLNQIYSSIVILVFTIGGGINLINNLLVHFANAPITLGVLVIVFFSIINAILELPFNIYATFGIEQRFGFNKSTVGLFITDLFKGLILMLVLGVPLLYLIIWVISISGNQLWWFWVWLVLAIFNLFILFVYPRFIAPLFNKFVPLEAGDLKNLIEQLLLKCGFKSSGVFVMDGSKRSTHGNAYFTGFGKNKRIVFFDTLIKQLSHKEIEAVLAHELGHFKKKHVLKRIIGSLLLNLVTLYIASLLIKNYYLYNSMGVHIITYYNGLILIMILAGLLSVPLQPIFSYLSRKHEFEADYFATRYTNKNELITGLIKMYKDNASTLTPDKLYSQFYYSHPPATIRIEHLENAS
jgi:STE24 endopeptidase